MPYPTKYNRQYDFQGYQVGNPTRPLPGDKVNADLNALKQSVGEIVDFLKGSIRSDGKLANGSVGVNQLDATFDLGFSLPTTWEAGVAYTTDSTVLHGNKFYKANVDHTSTDGFDESKWDLIVDFGEQATAAAASATAAATSETNAAASATTATTQAGSASDSATAAGNSATAASGSATTSTEQATAASNSATAAATQATAASSSATAAASAKTAAESARDAALSAVPNAFPATRAALGLLDTTTTTAAFLKESGRDGQFIFKSGDYSSQVTIDTAQGTYVPPTIAPTGATGAWLRIRPNGNLHKVSEYGGDVAAALATCAINGGVVEANVKGTIIPAAGLIIPPNVSLIGLGAENTVIDFSSLESGLVGPNSNYAVYKSGDGLTALPSFTSIVADDEHITFVSAHGLKSGDIICVYDSADGSWLPDTSGFGGRYYYRRGQRARVIDVNSNTVYLDQPIYFNYASGGTVTIYKQSSTYGEISGLSLTMEGTSISGSRLAKIMYGDRCKALDLRCLGGQYEGLAVYQGYQTEVSGVFATDLQTASSNSYPLSIINSSHTHAHDFSAVGKWAGTELGGDDAVGGIQNYDNKFVDFLASGKTAPGCDMHGNSDKTNYVRGIIRNGVAFAGRDCVYADCRITDGEYPYAAVLTEVYGGRHAIINSSIEIKNANYVGYPSIHGYGGGAFRSAKSETFFELKNVRIAAPLSNFLIGLRNDSASQKLSHDIDITIYGGSSLNNTNGPLRIYQDSATPGPGTYGKVRMNGLPNAIQYAAFEANYSCTLYDYPEQRGKVTITTTASNVCVGANTLFRNPYPVAPVLVLGPGVVPTSSQPYAVVQYADVTTTALRPAIWRVDGTNFTSGATTIINWRAKL